MIILFIYFLFIYEVYIHAFDSVLCLLVLYFLLYQAAIWEESPPRFYRKLYTRTVSDLQPYVEYEFRVRLHTGTGPIREEMWSKPALLTKRTEATRKLDTIQSTFTILTRFRFAFHSFHSRNGM